MMKYFIHSPVSDLEGSICCSVVEAPQLQALIGLVISHTVRQYLHVSRDLKCQPRQQEIATSFPSMQFSETEKIVRILVKPTQD